MLFQQYGGLKEVRLIASRHMAFVEFESEQHSSVALKMLNNFKLSQTHLLHINYAKK